MKISILTISPDEFTGLKANHVIDRAEKLGLLSVSVTDIRSFAEGCYRKVDDSPYGGGAGMILRIAPVMDALRFVTRDDTDRTQTCIAAFSPAGSVYSQQMAHTLCSYDHLVLICGHYEGMDARIFDHADLLLSIGDYVLSGGEIPAMAVADSVARLLPGVLRRESLAEESFSGGLLEYPQYTRPADYMGEKVPEVLLSGDHAAILRWRREQSEKITAARRPDLFRKSTRQ